MNSLLGSLTGRFWAERRGDDPEAVATATAALAIGGLLGRAGVCCTLAVTDSTGEDAAALSVLDDEPGGSEGRFRTDFASAGADADDVVCDETDTGAVDSEDADSAGTGPADADETGVAEVGVVGRDGLSESAGCSASDNGEAGRLGRNETGG